MSVNKLLKRGWSKEGAQFLIDHKAEMPPLMLRKLFGKKHSKPQPKRQCSKCGYKGTALDWHHIHGRRNSPKTIVLCANCHRETHAEQSKGAIT